MTRWLAAWAPALAWSAAIFAASSRSSVPLGPGFPGADKLLHAAAYAVLGAALAWGGARRGVPAGRLVWVALLYGATDELHQAFVPGREPDVLDWVADAAGALAGVHLFSRLLRRPARLPDP